MELEAAPAGSSSDDLDIDTDVIYTITVEARSDHLSGKSEPMIYVPSKSIIPHYVTIL